MGQRKIKIEARTRRLMRRYARGKMTSAEWQELCQRIARRKGKKCTATVKEVEAKPVDTTARNRRKRLRQKRRAGK